MSATSSSMSSLTSSGLAGLRVLVVDDVRDNLLLLEQLLCKAGASVDFAMDGQEGVDKALRHTYDVILMDIQMPVLDGLQATAALRETGYTRAIVSLTAFGAVNGEEECLAAGCDVHLTKPIRFKALVDTLSKYRQH